MSTVLDFKPGSERRPRTRTPPQKPCEIVIFPGVRIERQSVDLGHRLRDSAGRGDFNGLGGKRRPRKTS